MSYLIVAPEKSRKLEVTGCRALTLANIVSLSPPRFSDGTLFIGLANPQFYVILSDVSRKCFTGEDVTFALDPFTSPWAQAGFSRESNWWVWKIAGVAPEEAFSYTTPLLWSARLCAAAHDPETHSLPWDDLDVSGIESMRGVFAQAETFNEPIGKWDVSGATSFDNMFNMAKCFNQPIGTWDMSSATSMYGMFFGAEQFNQNLGAWRTHNLRNTELMFCRAFKFNQSLATWDISRLVRGRDMFRDSGISPHNFSSTLIGWKNCAEMRGCQSHVDMGLLPHPLRNLTAEGRDALSFFVGEHGWVWHEPSPVGTPGG